MIETLKAKRDAAWNAVHAAGWFPGADSYGVMSRAASVAPAVYAAYVAACREIESALRGTRYASADAAHV